MRLRLIRNPIADVGFLARIVGSRERMLLISWPLVTSANGAPNGH